jgi:carbonic anhydrase
MPRRGREWRQLRIGNFQGDEFVNWSNRLSRAFLGFGLACGLAMVCHGSQPDFSYSGDTGPGFWAEKSPACATTASSRQSPVNIGEVVVDRQLLPLDVLAGETSFTVKNPGYTVVASPRSAALLTLNGTTFQLLQFHFHTLSEHTLHGRHAVMELHAVFQDASSQLTVIAVMYRVGRENPFLATILRVGLPQKTTSPAVTVDGLNLANAFTDLSSYYTYPGSLTTPPCSENVTWFVLQQFAEMSASQLQRFRDVLGNDFRPLQNLNDRVILATRRGR